MTPFIIVIAVVVLIILVLVISSGGITDLFDDESAIRRAGDEGEDIAFEEISDILKEDDYIIRNVKLIYEDKRQEYDVIIVNRKGVYIIEIKNYVGRLYGSEEDYEWKKYKTTEAGEKYVKEVRNPIIQVKREIHILAKYLLSKGINVWVDGYAYLINENAPIESKYLLNDIDEIDAAIHPSRDTCLSDVQIKSILKLLSEHQNS